MEVPGGSVGEGDALVPWGGGGWTPAGRGNAVHWGAGQTKQILIKICRKAGGHKNIKSLAPPTGRKGYLYIYIY